jgi:hypothetical protein
VGENNSSVKKYTADIEGERILTIAALQAAEAPTQSCAQWHNM